MAPKLLNQSSTVSGNIGDLDKMMLVNERESNYANSEADCSQPTSASRLHNFRKGKSSSKP